jgi:hypothetical protein
VIGQPLSTQIWLLLVRYQMIKVTQLDEVCHKSNALKHGILNVYSLKNDWNINKHRDRTSY